MTNEEEVIKLLREISAKLDKVIENTHETAEKIRRFT